MDALVVVNHLYSLAEVEGNRESIVKDQGCLPGLVLFLDNPDNAAVLLVLKTLQLLAEHAPNRKVMFNEIGMIPSLRKIMNDEDERYKDEAEIKKLASSLYNKLQPPIARVSRQRIHTVAPTQQKFFVGATNKKAKLITLQIKGLQDDTTRKKCEENLLAIKGVVSFTFNMAKQRCMVRVTAIVTPEVLCNAVEKVKGLSAEQVVRNKSGEEVVISFGSQPEVPGEEKGKVDMNYPEYLPEEDPVETSNAAIARSGKEDSGGGWFSGVSNFINNTLYW